MVRTCLAEGNFNRYNWFWEPSPYWLNWLFTELLKSSLSHLVSHMGIQWIIYGVWIKQYMLPVQIVMICVIFLFRLPETLTWFAYSTQLLSCSWLYFEMNGKLSKDFLSWGALSYWPSPAVLSDSMCIIYNASTNYRFAFWCRECLTELDIYGQFLTKYSHLKIRLCCEKHGTR